MNVTALLAHPDDETSCAGTLARHVAEGHDVTLFTVFVDDRRPNLTKAVEVLGVQLVTLHLPPGAEDDFTFSRRWVMELDAHLPPTDLLISHRVCDPNSSHHHLGHIARTLARKNTMSLWEIDHTITGGIEPDAPAPNLYVNISAHRDTKDDVIACYPDHVDADQRLAFTARDLHYGTMIGVHSAEAFRIIKDVR